MADNLTPTGAGGIVGTDQRTIDGASVHVQRVDEQGSSAIAAGQQNSIGTTATQIAAARETRKRIVLRGVGARDVQVGPSGVTWGTGELLRYGEKLPLMTAAAVFGVVQAGTGSVHYVEEYDA